MQFSISSMFGNPRDLFRVNKPKIFSVLVVVLAIELSGVLKYKHPDFGLTIDELVAKHNYSLDYHKAITEDGYVLTLQRLKSNKDLGRSSTVPKDTVLMVPGFLNSAADFLTIGPNKSLAYFLYEAGFDVWLGNTRGTTFSREHIDLDPDIDKHVFWDFGMDEIGFYDLPAMIDYVLSATKQEQLHYIGFSQGTTTAYIMLSEKPEYNNKIKLISAIAPAAFLSNTISPIIWSISHVHRIWEAAWDAFGVLEFFAADSIYSQYYLKVICDENSLFVHLCLLQQFMLLGVSYEQLDMSRLSVIYTNFPAGGATRQVNQYIQYANHGHFRKYDFGTQENLIRYGQESPPAYNLSQISVPVASYYAENDWTITEKDALRCISLMPNSVKAYKVPHKSFNHIDFLYSKDVDVLFAHPFMEEILRHK